MSRGVQGALWMGQWLRQRRTALGLSRQLLVRSGQVQPRPLTIAIVQDLERGDRLPSLNRIPALAKGLRIRPWILSELSWLAPRVERHWKNLRQLNEPAELISRAAVDLMAERTERAAAGAELALRLTEKADPNAGRARLLLASALWVLGQNDLAARFAGTAWESGQAPTAGQAALVLAEIAAAECRPRAGESWLERSGRIEQGEVNLQWPLRGVLVRAELDLAMGRPEVARGRAVEVIELRSAGRWLRGRALGCLERSALALGQGCEVAHWRRIRNQDLLENDPGGPPG